MYLTIIKSHRRAHLFYVIFAMFWGANSLAAPNDEPESQASSEVNVLSSWSLPDANGNIVDFSPRSTDTYRVVLFWATWCPYCKALMPYLERFRAKHENAESGSAVEFLALNVWEDGDPQAYMEESGYQFRLVPNADQVAKDYGVKGTPGLFLVNGKNEVLYERLSGTSPEQVVTDLEFVLANRHAANK